MRVSGPVPTTAATSKRASLHESHGIRLMYSLAVETILRRLASPTVSSGAPNSSPSRKRTSTKTRMSPSRATMSTSPPRTWKLRSTIRIPLASRNAQAAASASAPDSRVDSGGKLMVGFSLRGRSSCGSGRDPDCGEQRVPQDVDLFDLVGGGMGDGKGNRLRRDPGVRTLPCGGGKSLRIADPLGAKTRREDYGGRYDPARHRSPSG